MKRGLVLEGGAMRGLYTAGVIDVMMENGISYDGMIGVSAGAAFGCNYKSRQPGRVIRYNTRFCRDKRYCSLETLVKTGNLYDAEYCYHIVPTQYDVFDGKTFAANPMEFYVTCTDVETGEPVYHRVDKTDYEGLEWVRASASMPLVARIVALGGRKLLDGGIADSIPLKKFEQLGYDRNVVVLTRPAGYVKQPNNLVPIVRLAMREYPKFVEALAARPAMYNAEVAYVREREREGKAFVFSPDEALPIGYTCHDPALMWTVYELGREQCKRRLAELRDFLG